MPRRPIYTEIPSRGRDTAAGPGSLLGRRNSFQWGHLLPPTKRASIETASARIYGRCEFNRTARIASRAGYKGDLAWLRASPGYSFCRSYPIVYSLPRSIKSKASTRRAQASELPNHRRRIRRPPPAVRPLSQVRHLGLVMAAQIEDPFGPPDAAYGDNFYTLYYSSKHERLEYLTAGKESVEYLLHKLQVLSTPEPIFSEGYVPLSVSSSQMRGMDIMVGSSTVHLPKHSSVGGGTPVNSIGHSKECHSFKICALAAPQSTTPDGSSPSTGTVVPSMRIQPHLCLDSGATMHMVGDPGILSNLQDAPAGLTVATTDGSQHTITQIGVIQTPGFEISDVNFVPGFQTNLISVRQLSRSGIVTSFDDRGQAMLFMGQKLVGVAVAEANMGDLYWLRFLKMP